MPAATLAPRLAPAQNSPTTGPAAALESRLLRVYRARLHQATQEEVEAWALIAYGPLLTRATQGKPSQPLVDQAARRALDARVEQLDEVLPELLMLLRPSEQTEIAPLLLEQQDLAGFAQAVVKLNGSGNALYKREAEGPELRDDYLFKAAGMGRLGRADTLAGWQASQRARGLPTGGPPLTLTPPPVLRKPALRTKKRRARRPLVLRGQYALFPVGVLTGGGL